MNRAAVTKRILTLEQFVAAFDEFVAASETVRTMRGRPMLTDEDKAALSKTEQRFSTAQHELGRRRRQVGAFVRYVPD